MVLKQYFDKASTVTQSASWNSPASNHRSALRQLLDSRTICPLSTGFVCPREQYHRRREGSMDDKPDTAFVFDALPEGSIRLLRIAISEDDPASVDLHIQTVPLGVAPTFDALSYVWGPNPDRQLYHIRCTDETTRKTGWLPIVPNLLGAMPWLRVFSTVPI